MGWFLTPRGFRTDWDSIPDWQRYPELRWLDRYDILLPVLLAVLSSFRDRPLPDKLVAFGEIGLSGEIRPVPNGEERLREAATHGFRHAIVPRANAPKRGNIGELKIIPVDRLADALSALAEI